MGKNYKMECGFWGGFLCACKIKSNKIEGIVFRPLSTGSTGFNQVVQL
jgi:hypothetical protein